MKLKLNKKILFLVLFFIFLVILIVYILYMFKETFVLKKKKYAVCLYAQQRAIKETVDSLYENVLNHLDADLFLALKKTDIETENKFELYKDRLVGKHIYEQPDFTDKYKEEYEYIKLHNNDNNNKFRVNFYSIMHNFHVINTEFTKTFEDNYEYIIFSRTDMKYLIPFPDILEITDNNEIIWSCNRTNGLNGRILWFDLNTFAIPSKYIRQIFHDFYYYATSIEELKSNERLQNLFDIEEYTMRVVNLHNNHEFGLFDSILNFTFNNEIVKNTGKAYFYNEKYKTNTRNNEELETTYNNLSNFESGGKKWKYITNEEYFYIRV